MKFKVWKEGKINKNCITLWGKRWQRSILFLKYLCNLYGTEILKDIWSYSAENKIMNSSVWQKWHRMRLKSFHEEKTPKKWNILRAKKSSFYFMFSTLVTRVIKSSILDVKHFWVSKIQSLLKEISTKDGEYPEGTELQQNLDFSTSFNFFFFFVF
jgi:hypothetical protein